ncbi:MAG: agmatinase [Thermodesulfobacteriota bacterium]|nr:MAG: agmatinase [Thermodesulfobacteriota bacterium]
MSNFGGLTEEDIRGKAPRFSVISVPYDLTASYGEGARRGPGAIIEASTHMELYDEETGDEPCAAGIETLAPLEPTAAGPEEMIKEVTSTVDVILDAGKIPVVLGGEHSITLGAVKAALERYPDLSVLQFDAHADMRDSFQGTPFSHACVARRISELCPIVQVGIRSMSLAEAGFLKGAGGEGKTIKTYHASPISGGTAPEEVAEKALKDLTGDVYITVDIDVLDPSIMPATGTPEPGGLGWYEVLNILKNVISKRTIRGFDVVELSPLPGMAAPDFLAAKLVYKIMAYINEGMKC